MTIALQGTASIACDEHELVAAVRRGDDRAFEVLFSAYERRITGYVAGMVGDHARAEDITQDVFISALRRMRETDRPIAFKPWIYEIAKNACIDEFRRARRNQEVAFEEGDGSGIVARHVCVHAPAPQTAIESKQRLHDLCGAFGGLSENHHRVLVLRELEGLSYGEIAERLGMTRAMVESTLFRARRRLGEEYEELTSGRRCARVQSLIEAGTGRPLTSLGVRDRRQLVRHLSHCNPCRRQARLYGLDESLLEPRRGFARLAALIPLPLPLLRWRRGGSAGNALARSGSHSFSLAQSIPSVAPLVDPSGPAAAFSRAAAAVAAIAIASASGGIVAGFDTGVRRSNTVAPASASGRLPALSITKILGPVTTSGPAVGAAASPFASATAPAGGGLSQPPGGISGSETNGKPAGPVPARPGGGGSVPDSGGSKGSSAGGSASGPAGPPNGVSVPQGVQGSGPPTGPTAPTTPPPPTPPAPPNDGPSVGAPGVPSDPTGAVQGVQAPSTGSVQSTVQSAPATATQTVGEAPQSVPPPPANTAVSPSPTP